MDQLLTTKLHIPPSRTELVTRPRLVRRLNEGVHHKLTIISAPAGYGKTTLVSEWLGNLRLADKKEGQHVYQGAWLSLDEGDNDLVRFLTYFITAHNRLEGSESNLGEGVLGMLQSPQPPPTEDTLTTLINEVAAISAKFILVLDDYHRIDAQPVHDALSFFLEHLPAQIHLVITTREDPPFPLARLRARGQLTELRAADLRFTPTEAAEFLNQVMGLSLSAEDVDALETRTEGWITGLQLAAVSLQGHTDSDQFIKSFTGSHRFVLDYLIEEVLKHQSESVQHFLLKTAILDRMEASLCDALTGNEGSQQTLEYLERANLFIVPLDEERCWYRYHHLFADLLRQKLRHANSEQISELHLLASEWFEQRCLWSEAIRHAFTAEEPERVADLAELAWDPMNRSYQSVTWLGWVQRLPADLVRSRPALSIGCGWASLDTGDLEAAELYLRDAERWLGGTPNTNQQPEITADKTVVLEEVEFRSLSISKANARAYLAQALGDVSGTLKYAQQATDLLHENDYFEHGLADILAGFAYWASGDLEAAYQAIADAVSKMKMSGRILFVISFTSYLADIMTAQGRLRETAKTYLQLLETALEQGEPVVPETAVLHLGLSELFIEQGDMEAAKRHLRISETLGEQFAFAPWYRHWIYAHYRIMEAQGNLDEVIEMLNGAECLYYRHPIPDVRPLNALMARARLAKGELTEAQRFVHERGLAVEDDLSFLGEFEHITLARVLIAYYRDNGEVSYIHDTVGLLARLLEAAEEGHRKGSVIEILVLQALAYEAQGKISAALKPLERSLKLAEAEGYVRIFVGEGPPMARLLHEALSRGTAPEYIRRLLSAFPAAGLERVDESAIKSGMVEPLSEREIEVLQLIAEGFTNPQIAARLYLSPNTVKVHTRNIYGKLGVHSRTQAIARTQELGLLPRRSE